MLCLIISTITFAQPTNNDICNAIPIFVNPIGSSPNCFGQFPYDNAGANDEVGEMPASCYGIPGAQTVWFSFVAPFNGYVTVSTNFFGGTNIDTQIAIWEGTINCPTPNFNSFTEIACSEDVNTVSGNFLSEIPATAVIPGVTYYVQAAGWNGRTGTFCLDIAAASPCNNNFACEMGETVCSCSDCFCAAQIVGIEWPALSPTDTALYCPEE